MELSRRITQNLRVPTSALKLLSRLTHTVCLRDNHINLKDHHNRKSCTLAKNQYHKVPNERPLHKHLFISAQQRIPIDRRDVCTWGAPQPREPCVVMQGHTLADDILDEVRTVADLVTNSQLARRPCLSIVLVGSDPASHKYVRSKVKAGKAVGIDVRVLLFPSNIKLDESVSALMEGFIDQKVSAEEVTTEQLCRLISELNVDESTDGVIVQLPLPHHIDTFKVTDCVASEKDVDGFGLRTHQALTTLAEMGPKSTQEDKSREQTGIFCEQVPTNDALSLENHARERSCSTLELNTFSLPNYANDLPRVHPAVFLNPELYPSLDKLVHYPCTPLAIMALLHRYKISVKDMNVAVLGRGLIVGEPLVYLLRNAGARLASITQKTPDDIRCLALKNADIVVAAIGQPCNVKGESLSKKTTPKGLVGPVVIDVGINFVQNAAPTTPSVGKEEIQSGFSSSTLEQLEEQLVHQKIPPRKYDCVDTAGRENEKAKNVRLVGDVDAPSVRKVAKLLTPVPGGVGPLTVAMLLRNTVVAAASRAVSKQN